MVACCARDLKGLDQLAYEMNAFVPLVGPLYEALIDGPFVLSRLATR